MTTPTTSRPVVGAVYTAKEIETRLQLLDVPSYLVPVAYWPHLDIKVRGGRLPIQTSSLTVEEALAIPLFAGTLWMYLRTTHEWIPVFYWADLVFYRAEPNVKPQDFLDVYIDEDRTDDDDGKHVLLFKGQVPPWPGNFRLAKNPS